MNKLNLIIHALFLLKSSPTRTPLIDEEKILATYQQPHSGKSGIAIKVLSVFGGIAASLFFLAFLFLAGLYESEIGMLVFGSICIIAAVIVNSRFDNLLVDTASISFFLAGYFLVGVGLGSMHFNEYQVCLIFIGIAILTQLIIQNYIFSFVSILIVNGSIMAMIIFSSGNNWIHPLLVSQAIALTYLFFFEATFIAGGTRVANLFRPLRTGMLVSFLAGLVIIGKRDLFFTSWWFMITTGVVIILALLYTAYRLIDLLGVSKTSDKLLVYAIAAVMCMPTVAAPSISGSLLVILLCFFVKHRGGFILAMISLLYFVCQFYYDLNYSLLVKSFFLVGSGLVFISIYLITVKKFQENAKA